jgi:hypothetical protein
LNDLSYSLCVYIQRLFFALERRHVAAISLFGDAAIGRIDVRVSIVYPLSAASLRQAAKELRCAHSEVTALHSRLGEPGLVA